MSNDNTEKALVDSPYYIFVDSGDKMYVLGNSGSYEESLNNAIGFNDKLAAIEYVEKLGYQKIATIRKLH